MEWNTAEIVLLLTTIGSITRWWFDRRDARSALTKAKNDADKAVITLKETVMEKNSEIEKLEDQHRADREEWQEERRDLRERITHLELLRDRH